MVEIKWPLVLFIILVAARNRQNYGATNIPDSIYRPRALPSAGLFPFARSFLCDFKNTKTSDPSELLNGLPNLRSSSLSRLFEDALPLVTNNSLRERLLRFNEDYSKFTTDSKLWNDLMNNSSRPVQWDGYNLSAVPLDKLLKDPAQFQEFLYKTTKLSPRVVAELFNSTVNVQKIAAIVEPYRSLSQESLSWFPRNPLDLENLPLPSSNNNRQVNLFWSLLLMRIGSTIESQGTIIVPWGLSQMINFTSLPLIISGSEVEFIICDSRSPVNLQKILNGPGNVDHQRNLSKLLRSLQEDVRNLNEDVQALQSFQQVTEDYVSFMQDLQAGGFQATLCGRKSSDDEDEDDHMTRFIRI